MNIDKLKAMLDLKAVQSFGSGNAASSDSALFSDILSEILTEDEMTELTKPIDSSDSSSSLSVLAGTSLPPLSLLKSSGSFDEIINQAAQKYQLPANLISAVINQESNFNPNALSKSGASGLMQLMPSTARSLGADDIFDPEQNIMAGSKYLRQMLDKYNGNIEFALAAYNAGPGNVDKYGGIPPFAETVNYVNKITSKL